MDVAIKRVRDAPSKKDGYRVLVDRLWPRGMKREQVQIDAWLKEVAPSNELRRWFGHDETRWSEFQSRYAEELDRNPSAWQELSDRASRERVTLLYDAKAPDRNNAVALRSYLLQRRQRPSDSRRGKTP